MASLRKNTNYHELPFLTSMQYDNNEVWSRITPRTPNFKQRHYGHDTRIIRQRVFISVSCHPNHLAKRMWAYTILKHLKNTTHTPQFQIIQIATKTRNPLATSIRLATLLSNVHPALPTIKVRLWKFVVLSTTDYSKRSLDWKYKNGTFSWDRDLTTCLNSSSSTNPWAPQPRDSSDGYT